MTQPPDQTARVEYDAPLDLVRSLAPLQVGRYDPAMQTDDRTVRMTFRTPDGAVTLLLEHAPDPPGVHAGDPRLGPGMVPTGSVHAAAWGPGADWALERLPDLVGLNDRPADFEPELPALRRLHAGRLGHRFVRTHRVAELLPPIILQQLVTWRDAVRAWTGLVRNHGEPAPGPFDELMLPPAARTLARLPAHRIVAVGGLRKQAVTIQRAAMYASRLDEAAAMDADDAYARLTAIPGIGPWTAGSVMMRGMGFADAVPVGDFHLPHVIAWNLAGEPRGDDARMLELLEPYRGHRGRVVHLVESSGGGYPKRGPRLARRDMKTW